MKKKTKRAKLLFKFLLILILIFTVLNINGITKRTSGEDTNPLYTGEGKRIVKDKLGYDSIFITNGEKKKRYIEYKQGKNAPWAKNEYWGRHNGGKWMWNNFSCNNS